MIRVNLMRDTMVTSIKKDGTFATVGGMGTKISQADNKDVIVKILMALIPLVAAFVTLSTQEGQKDAEVAKISSQIDQKKKERENLGADLKAVEEYKKEKDKLQIQIDTIKQLSRERLRNVKALEALQNIFPEKAWLGAIKIDGNKASLEGSAVDDRIVADLMSSMESNIYFSGVKLIKSSEVQSKDGSVKSFSIDCDLEGM